jgi:hypothetical protein
LATKAKKVEPAQKTPATKRTVLEFLTEKSTWAGLLTIGATFATGGAAGWLNAATLPSLLAGIGLILTKEGK